MKDQTFSLTEALYTLNVAFSVISNSLIICGEYISFV